MGDLRAANKALPRDKKIRLLLKQCQRELEEAAAAAAAAAAAQPEAELGGLEAGAECAS